MDPTTTAVANDFYRLVIAVLVFSQLIQAIYLAFSAFRFRGVRREEIDELKSEIDERLSRLSEKISSSNDGNQSLFRDIMLSIGEIRGRLPKA